MNDLIIISAVLLLALLIGLAAFVFVYMVATQAQRNRPEKERTIWERSTQTDIDNKKTTTWTIRS